MKLKGSIFNIEKKGYEKVWKNKKYFPLLTENFNTITERLKDLGIEEVLAFDMISNNWEDWKNENKLRLVIMPICNIINQEGTSTKDFIKGLGLEYTDEMGAIDITTDEIHESTFSVVYFKTRNLIVVKFNPFYNTTLLDETIFSFEVLDIKKLSEETIGNILLEEQWFSNIEDRKRGLTADIVNINSRLESMKEDYIKRHRERLNKTRQLKDLDINKDEIRLKIKQELDKLKENTLIKKLTIKDKIYLSFGDIYINAQVKTGLEINQDGIEVPKVEMKKIYIGNLTFIVGEGKVTVENPSRVDDYEHPHANGGTICFGEVSLKASQHLINLELNKLVKLLYSWAFSYNEGDAYCKIQEFYEARIEDKNEKR